MSDEAVQTNDGDKPVFEGRKVFFLYPTASVQNQIITELVQQEYEVYTCKDHVQLVRVLKKYPNSLLFVNVDEGMHGEEWEKWIATLKTSMPDLQFGIFSSNSSEEMQEKYLNGLKVSCGFMTLKVDMSKTIGVVVSVLEKMNVKGRRKYIRVTTDDEQTATINVPFDGGYINGTINDISVVGFSCVFEKEHVFKKNSLYKNIQIRLKTMLLKVEAVMFGSRQNDNGMAVYVFLFTQRVDSDVRVKIRKYIQLNLQSKMDAQLS